MTNKLYQRVTTNRLFNIWRDMLRRCEVPTKDNYKWYGGKGIIVCTEWHTFNIFVDWAISTGYQDTLTIDRIDNRGNYEPSNCRWATHKAQCNHRTSNQLVTYQNETHTIMEWSKIIGIPAPTLYHRKHRGLSPEEILSKDKICSNKKACKHVERN